MEEYTMSQSNIYSIVWYDDGGDCWCESCIYVDSTVFNNHEDAEKYAEDKQENMDCPLEYRIQHSILQN
jgi:hypothetical protein